MPKKKRLSREEKLLNALNNIPHLLFDEKHRIFIKFENDRARSNETRYEHILVLRHELLSSDIRKIPRCINESDLKIDKERKDTYYLLLKRNNYSNEHIKICLKLNFKESNIGIVKTIFITKNPK